MDGFMKLVPVEELHWNEYEKKYTVLSMQEIDQIIEICHSAGMDENDVYKVVLDYELVKMGHLLYKRLLDGHIDIGKIDEDGKPSFRQK